MFYLFSAVRRSTKHILSGFSLAKMLYCVPVRRPCLNDLAALPEHQLPRLVRESPAALRYMRLLGQLDWTHFPEKPGKRIWPNFPSIPFSAFAAACLVKIDQKLVYMSDLRQYLVENPALLWALGFPLVKSGDFPWGSIQMPVYPLNGTFAVCCASCRIKPWLISWMKAYAAFRPNFLAK
jgi:hypothetical protein